MSYTMLANSINGLELASSISIIVCLCNNMSSFKYFATVAGLGLVAGLVARIGMSVPDAWLAKIPLMSNKVGYSVADRITESA